MRTIARNILAAREERGWTQREVAVALGIESRSVSRWENGKVTPSGDSLAALADLFTRDPGWFYTDHDKAAV